MVDEYLLFSTAGKGFNLVQIPLWSMNTPGARDLAAASKRVQIPLWSMNTRDLFLWIPTTTTFRFLYGRWIPGTEHRSVSSLKAFRFLYGRWIPVQQFSGFTAEHVQIPLWSMNTVVKSVLIMPWPRSDSSMVDEYRYNRQGYRAYSRSDSSMVDEYAELARRGLLCDAFRFLYGRWIRWNLNNFL